MKFQTWITDNTGTELPFIADVSGKLVEDVIDLENGRTQMDFRLSDLHIEFIQIGELTYKSFTDPIFEMLFPKEERKRIKNEIEEFLSEQLQLADVYED